MYPEESANGTETRYDQEHSMNVTVLQPEDIEKLHEASLAILETAGVHLPHDGALALFADTGARVDQGRKHVTIPADLVAWALEVCGKEFTLYGRDRARTAAFGVGKRNYNSIAGEAFWVNDRSTERRYARLD